MSLLWMVAVIVLLSENVACAKFRVTELPDWDNLGLVLQLHSNGSFGSWIGSWWFRGGYQVPWKLCLLLSWCTGQGLYGIQPNVSYWGSIQKSKMLSIVYLDPCLSLDCLKGLRPCWLHDMDQSQVGAGFTDRVTYLSPCYLWMLLSNGLISSWRGT